MNWQETIPKLDISPAARIVAAMLELQTHQPPALVFKVNDSDLCMITPKFLTDLTHALHKHLGGLVHVMVGHDGEVGRVVH